MEVLGLALVAVSYCYEMSSSYPCADQVFALFIRHAKHRNLEPVKEVLVFPCLISALVKQSHPEPQPPRHLLK